MQRLEEEQRVRQNAIDKAEKERQEAFEAAERKRKQEEWVGHLCYFTIQLINKH